MKTALNRITVPDFQDKSGPARYIMIGAVSLVVLMIVAMLMPFASVPTGTRGVITQFGAIQGIVAEGLAFVPPWQRLTIFIIRAEEADIKDADGSTADTQPVKVSLTVRYNISTERVAEVYERYSHDGDLSSYVQTAAQEVFKAVTAGYSAPDLISQRARVSTEISNALRAKLVVYGAQVINIDMTNFRFQKIT